MNSSEFQHWCQTLQLQAATCDLIAAIRTTPPSRRVQERASSIMGTYASHKRGATIQFESHTIELRAIYQMEHDPNVLEFYNQLPPIKLQYQSQSGRQVVNHYTPDFFVLRTSGVTWEEWKTENQLHQLSQRYPTRYQRTEERTWRCPPGEAYAQSFGLEYRVRSDLFLF
jgi:putative transposase